MNILALCCALAALSAVHAQRSLYCGMNIDPGNSQYGNPPVSAITQVNATWVRIEFQDASTGAQPQQYPLYDPVVDGYVAAGIHVLMILDYSTYPGNPGSSGSLDQWQAYAKDFSERASAIASHYGDKVAAYEIWNEEDLSGSGGYDPYISPDSYAYLLQSAYNAVKGASTAYVVMGGLASGNPGYVSSVLQSNSGNLFADAVGLHPYGQRPFPDWPNPTWGFGVLTDLLQNYENVVPGTPLWITEVGTDDTSVQDEFPSETFSAIQQWNPAACPVVIWFCWSDGMVPPFGVVDVNNNPKGSYYSFQSWASQPFTSP